MALYPLYTKRSPADLDLEDHPGRLALRDPSPPVRDPKDHPDHLILAPLKSGSSSSESESDKRLLSPTDSEVESAPGYGLHEKDGGIYNFNENYTESDYNQEMMTRSLKKEQAEEEEDDGGI